ncbi:MAG: methyl-accepting chemotaxis protein [Candidatus Competibacteraceae bacterium]
MQDDAVIAKSRISLSTKYVGLVVVTLGLLFTVTALLISQMETDMIRKFDERVRQLIDVMTQSQMKELREAQRFKAVQLTQLMAASSQQPLANYDYPTVERYAGLAVKDSDISFVDFRSQNGDSFAKAGQVDNNHPVDQIIRQEILDGDQPLAEVRVGYNLERIERQQTAIVAQGNEELQRLDEQTHGDLRQLRLVLAVTMAAIIFVTGCVVLGLFRWLVLRYLRLAVTHSSDIAQGVLHYPNDSAYPRDEMGQLLTMMRSMAERLRSVVGEVRRSADAIGEVAGDIARGNADIHQRTEEQTATLHDTAAGIEHLTDTVRRNADCARQAEQLAADAWAQAEQGGIVVRQTIAAMDAVNASSRKIADIISVVNGIAFQTNLLALNAAVEAARAGEQGRGFAVVAGEVRKLAQRSAEAAQEIKNLITDSVGKADEGDKLVNRSGQTLEAIMSAVKKVSDIVVEVAAVSREQASGIEKVNQAIMRLDQVAQRNAALSGEAAVASGSLDRETENLLELMAFFQLAAEEQPPVASR